MGIKFPSEFKYFIQESDLKRFQAYDLNNIKNIELEQESDEILI